MLERSIGRGYTTRLVRERSLANPPAPAARVRIPQGEPMEIPSTRKTQVGLITLGCPKNTVDSEEMLRSLEGAEGIELRPDAGDAEVVVINTCAFIGPAKEQSIETILEAVGRKRRGLHRAVVVAGCLSERYRRELLSEIPEIDGFLGIAPGSSIVEAARGAARRNRGRVHHPSPETAPPPAFPEEGGWDTACERPRDLAARLTPRHTAYVKISEGCDNPCTFCAIPSFRGRHASRPPEEILADVQSLAGQGAVEINVVAQDTTSYGRDLPGGPPLSELLPAIAATPGVAWTRLLYAYPRFVTDELLDAIARTPGICPYIDIPLQHAAGRVLKRMGRGLDREALRGLVGQMRARIPGVFLRTTMIVGFPGETESDFGELLDFVREARFERLGAFLYSPEDGTPAFRLPDDVPLETKRDRYDRLMRLQQEIAFAHQERFIGSALPVIVEGRDRDPGRFVGRTIGDAPEIDGRIFLRGHRLEPGRIYDARVTAAEGYDLAGEVPDSAGSGTALDRRAESAVS